MNSDNDDKELKQIWSLFNDSPEDVQQKRQKVTQLIHENNLSSFPDEISIVNAFDDLLSCFSLGGQLKHYYRYGSYSTCERQREKFWFAIKNGTFYEQSKPIEHLSSKDLEKREKIQEFFKKRLLEDKVKGSSEDIWDARGEILDKPFRQYKDN